MQLTSASAAATLEPRRDLLAGETGSAMTPADARFAQYKVIRRNGAVVGFEPAKITIAMTKAFLAVNGGQGCLAWHEGCAGVRIEQGCELRECEIQRRTGQFGDASNAAIDQPGDTVGSTAARRAYDRAERRNGAVKGFNQFNHPFYGRDCQLGRAAQVSPGAFDAGNQCGRFSLG